MDTSGTMENKATSSEIAHLLYDKWVLWAHLPHDTDWSIKSYKKIMTVKTIEEMVALYSAIPEKLVKNCMLFVMRDGIKPMWEDPLNSKGGCFSFKVTNKAVSQVWYQLSYILVGETLTNDPRLWKLINGITISPKKSFCIIKIWLKDCTMQNPAQLTSINGLSIHGCLFKRHKPEF
jgi:translation initiation factor 4E